MAEALRCSRDATALRIESHSTSNQCIEIFRDCFRYRWPRRSACSSSQTKLRQVPLNLLTEICWETYDTAILLKYNSMFLPNSEWRFPEKLLGLLEASRGRARPRHPQTQSTWHPAGDPDYPHTGGGSTFSPLTFSPNHHLPVRQVGTWCRVGVTSAAAHRRLQLTTHVKKPQCSHQSISQQ